MSFHLQLWTIQKAECPFTEITWENTLDEVLALEGEPLDSYPSTYSGTTYTFSKDFHDMSGTIKYMFDDNDGANEYGVVIYSRVKR